MKKVEIEQVSIRELIEKIEETVKRIVAKTSNEKKEEELKILTRKQTAKLLNVSLPTLNHWAKKDVLIPFTIGTRVYYKKEDILNYMNQ